MAAQSLYLAFSFMVIYYELVQNSVYKLVITSMEKAWNFEIMYDIFYVDKICS
jgi:hypothetical protein